MASTNKPITFTVFKGSEDRQIVEATTTRDALHGDEMLLRITHSSLCGTDEHFLDKDMVLGHEGAGIVQALGPDVKTFKVGDSVAFGYQRGSCLSCTQCLNSLETFCPSRMFYGFSELDIGSMASHIVFREAFVYAIPQPLDKEAAAALMCGGATVFNCFDMFGIKPTERVGIVGYGGLGHIAVQFARAWGCEVVVFSSDAKKREEAMRMGANQFVDTAGIDESFPEGIVKPIDHLLVTASFQINWGAYIGIMNKPSTLYPLTVSFDELKLPYIPWLFGGITVQASIVSTRAGYRRMLEFAARHGIRSINEGYRLSKRGIENAMEDLRKGKMRYKAVLWADKAE